MDIPKKTLRNGFSLPVYGLGTWQMGGRWEADNSDDEREVLAIQAAIKKGLTHIDTAESYGNGHAEELIAQAMKGIDRSKLFIASKVSAANQAHDGVMRSFEASMKRLDTSYIDLYMLHRYPEPGIDIAGTMKALDSLVAQGVVKNIGVCNMSVNRLKEVQKHTTNKIVCNQLHYSLECREITELGILEYCQQNDILVVAWGPLQKGALDPKGILQEIAKKYDKTSYQVALNWLITQTNVVTIPKTSTIEHLEENLGCLGWELSPEDSDRLSREFPDQVTQSDRVPLNYQADVEV